MKSFAMRNPALGITLFIIQNEIILVLDVAYRLNLIEQIVLCSVTMIGSVSGEQFAALGQV